MDLKSEYSLYHNNHPRMVIPEARRKRFGKSTSLHGLSLKFGGVNLESKLIWKPHSYLWDGYFRTGLGLGLLFNFIRSIRH